MISKPKLRWVAAGLVVFALALSIVYAQRPAVIRLGIFTGGGWGVPSASTYAFVDGILERFEAEHPGVRVEYDSGIRHGDYPSWMADRILTGECPDVFLILDEDLLQYARLGVLKNLNPQISSDPDFQPDRYYPGTLERGRYDIQQFALPLEYNPEMMFVNISLLEKEGISIPDETWDVDDFYAICKQVTKDLDGNGTIEQFGVYGYDWRHAMTAYDVHLATQSGRLQLNQPSIVTAIGRLKELRQLEQETPPNQDDLDAGRVAFAPMSYAEFITYNPYPWRIKRYANFDWRCIPMPSQTKEDGFYSGSSLYMGISSRTLYANLSWSLLKAFCYEEQSQKEIVFNGLGVSPIVLDQYDPEIDGYYENIGISATLVDNIMKKNPQYSVELDDSDLLLLDTRIQSMIDGDDDLDLALMKLEQDLNLAKSEK
ncbi:extracellular solute-binding protein [uncultured Dubosiella sp.]|uniref:ABC transporter substrate-binding protein n=1 Tax=uncultured Dubosiella sp. TaxID=1937011 RepID=UPI00259B46B3|nr:extracellular solute-binding protein [uncultured Dubosiella sp.]